MEKGFQKKKFKFQNTRINQISLDDEVESKKIFKPIIFEEEDKDSKEVAKLKTNLLNEDGKEDNATKNTNLIEEEEEEEDPLEAYMQGIEKETIKQASEPSKGPRSLGMQEEQEDLMESFIDFRKKQPKVIIQKDMDSDEEVYATAKAIEENEMEYDSEDNLITKKKIIEPLKPTIHEDIDYPKINKVNYIEHEDIANLSEEKVKEIRQQLNIRVYGKNVAKPCIVFGHFKLSDKIIDKVASSQYEKPTAIQQQAVPIALSGRDIIGIAQTGSGKTAAYIWPSIMHIIQQNVDIKKGPIVIILAPTHELAYQIGDDAKKFSKGYNIKTCIACGGFSKLEQFKELRNGTHLLIATPGRLIDLIKMKATSFINCSFLVLDEADRMLDMGFEPQVNSIAQAIRKDRQTVLFSATFPKRIEKLSRKILKNSIKIVIGGIGMVNQDIDQQFEVLLDIQEKWNTLLKYLPSWVVNQYRILIFVSTIMATEQLSSSLNQAGYSSLFIHGDLNQQERDKVLNQFKKGINRIMIATDVAARGLDVSGINVVVNYDVAKDLDNHVHRVGRTGRAGNKGLALTMLAKSEKHDRFMAQEIISSYQANELKVPEVLYEVAEKKIKFKGNKFQPKKQFGLGFNPNSSKGQSSGFIKFQPSSKH